MDAAGVRPGPGAPAISADRSGTPGEAPAGFAPKLRMSTGWAWAMVTRVTSNRVSTWPARSWRRAAGEAWMAALRSIWAPASLRAATSSASWARYTWAPSGADTRTSTRAAPDPNAARLTGAYTLSRRPPNWLRSVAVSRRISEPSGSGSLGPSMSSRFAWMWAASRAAHIIGSQPMISSGLTCWATQAATCFLAAVTDASAPPPLPGTPVPLPRPLLAEPLAGLPAEPPAGLVLVRAIVTAPAPNTIAATTSTASTRHQGFSSRRCSHSRNVVASTVPQDGSAAGRLTGGPPVGRVAGAGGGGGGGRGRGGGGGRGGGRGGGGGRGHRGEQGGWRPRRP